MHWGRAVGCLMLVVALAVAAPRGAPAAASHQSDTLLVTVAVNAAGADRFGISDDVYDSDYVVLASDVAIALDRPAGSFRVVESFSAADAVLDEKLAGPDERGGISFSLDTGKLQLLAQSRGYEGVAVKVCTPRVRQIVKALVAPQSVGAFPGSRCRGWYQEVEEPPIRAVVQLAPDRQRYPSAVGRILGVSAISFGILGMGATLLRRGVLRRRSVASWLLSLGAGLGLGPLAWGLATFALWWTGAPADAMLLGGGSAGEQVARTMLPGLLFLLPGLLPGALLLTAPAKQAPPPPPPPAPVGPPAMTWWPAAWWPQWANRDAAPAPPPGYPPTDAWRPPVPAGGPPPPPAPGPPPGPPAAASGWAPPGSGGG